MDMDEMGEFGSSIMETIEEIIRHSTVKLSLIALKNFSKTLKEVGFTKAKIDEMEKQIATMLFIYHYEALTREAAK